MSIEPRWLSLDEAIEINVQEVHETGEPHFLRDQGALDQALHRPKWAWAYGENDVAYLAASLILGVARAHAFEQGNKRTAWVAGLTFAEMNGYRFSHPDAEIPGFMVESLAQGYVVEQFFGDYLAGFLVPLD